MNIQEQAAKLKLDSPKMASLTIEVRNQALIAIKDALYANKDLIFEANKADCDAAVMNGIPAPVMKRLKFDEDKLEAVCEGLLDLVHLPDPLHLIEMERELDEGLTLYRETCPIGVIGVIFEARPDALIQISALCLKSGNCSILKGGSETVRTNKVLFELIYKTAVSSGIPEGCMMQAEAREEIAELLSCHDSIDLLIPRGSNAFVQYIMNNTKIPVMGHAEGICHVYVDQDADIEKAVRVIIDSKTQYPAVCNAAETLLIHKSILTRLLPVLTDAFKTKSVTIRGTAEIQALTGCELVGPESFRSEYLDTIMTVTTVNDLAEAVNHINQYGSHHTDSIITENKSTAEAFMQLVDSASVYCNCSTRFADGFRYGFGAEVGVSTGKLHARGPVGLDGLVTYKYKLYGDGHIVADYAEGRKKFHFIDFT